MDSKETQKSEQPDNKSNQISKNRCIVCFPVKSDNISNRTIKHYCIICFKDLEKHMNFHLEDSHHLKFINNNAILCLKCYQNFFIEYGYLDLVRDHINKECTNQNK